MGRSSFQLPLSNDCLHCFCTHLRRISGNASSIRHIAYDHRSSFDSTVKPHSDAGQHDRARADHCAVAYYCVQIQTTRHVMGQDNRVMVDHAILANMDTFRPRAVDQRGRCDPGGRMNIHQPKVLANEGLPLLAQRLAWRAGRDLFGHGWSIGGRRRFRNAANTVITCVR